MKSNFFSIRNIVSVLAISGMIIGSTTASYAGSNKKETAVPVLTTSITPTVEYLESSEGQLFKIKFEAPQTTKVELNVTDEKGEVLYNNVFEAASFSKYVKLVNEGYETPSKIYFTLRELPNGAKHVFSVSNEQTLVQEVVITKL